ncbi:interleukin-17 receptor B isoform X2 [Labeo rohita]|uniref:interleukin-17 receptor B isoform X2 n=1 Tax=Labeo rohita TaxID=84645 RepID=UPI0021E2FD0B|nr:interleukin-17 receptor B isoform X2 [Labeo rohita]
MELLDMREIVAFFLLIQWTHSHNGSLNISVTCNKAENDMPDEWLRQHESNPSPVHELTAELSESQTSVIIRWSINVDSQWYADIYAVLIGDKIVVTFNTNLVADRHSIHLENREKPLKEIEWKGQCKVEKCEVELEYMEHMGPCEDLLISIIPHFKHCVPESQRKSQKVICMNFALAIGVGCVLMLLFMCLCCCIIYHIIQWVRGSKRATSVRVLVVYPAVDTVFQRSVLLLAESLQSRGGVSVVIDMWEKGSLAEQGPLRWLNTQADLAERVLIILPPQRTQTDDLKSKLVPSMPDDTVSASASNLFVLALNLVTSSAHDPHALDKFWVVSLNHDDKCVQTELRGRRMFVLPRDLKKLHRQLLSGAVESPKLVRCFRSFNCKNSSEQLEMNTDFPSCAKPVNLDKNPLISSY